MEMEESSKRAVDDRNKGAKYHLEYYPVEVVCLSCGKQIIMDLAYLSCVAPVCDACNKIRDENRKKPKKTYRGLTRRD